MKLNLSLCCFALVGVILTTTLQAKSDEKWKALEKQAEEYEAISKQFADMATQADATEPEKASFYKKISDNYEDMADIKDDAARDAKRGKWGKIKWDKYEEMAKENEELKKLIGHQDPKKKEEKKQMDKKKLDPSSKKESKESKEYKKEEKFDDSEKRIKELEHHLEIERKKLELKKLQEKKLD
jgi:hypothetical protein